MKVVVDIPDGMYDFLIEHTDRQFPYATEWVRQGTPYEERKTGKWISSTPLPMEADGYKHKRYWKCSVCGGHDFFNPQYSEKVKFCRYCGAELEVDE